MDVKTYLIFDSDVMKLRSKVNNLQAAQIADDKLFRESVVEAFEQLVTTLEHFSTLEQH